MGTYDEDVDYGHGNAAIKISDYDDDDPELVESPSWLISPK